MRVGVDLMMAQLQRVERRFEEGEIDVFQRGSRGDEHFTGCRNATRAQGRSASNSRSSLPHISVDNTSGNEIPSGPCKRTAIYPDILSAGLWPAPVESIGEARVGARKRE